MNMRELNLKIFEKKAEIKSYFNLELNGGTNGIRLGGPFQKNIKRWV